MLKNYTPLKYAIVFLVLSIGCVLVYNAAGSNVDSKGVLQEKFGFIPLGWLFFFIGSGFAIYFLIGLLCKRR
ncbi:MAG TPA: DUF3955 domain-containing protein [Candidatus Thioglobus sp.]|jgi:hypothetical protein|nr:DUF3955 domain-containing protein [Candidatus Thioglobus sp.]HIL20219.1 DUF3955 domain-containing protein [Candidatus Thioglobus sp.]